MMNTFSEEVRARWLITIFGCILYIAGAGILNWNEGQAVHTALSLDEACSDAISLDPLDEQDHNYDGRIVHLIGEIIIGEPLTEPDYNIQLMAVKLKRRVQMYQWVEETIEHSYGESVGNAEGNDRSYYYTREWRDKLIDSRHFYMPNSHRNPKKFPIESQLQIADAVYIGKYELGTEIKKKFNNFQELTSDIRPEDPDIKLHLGFYYHTNDVFNPEIGDVRLLFTFAGMEGETYTIVGKLNHNKVVPYKTKHNVDVLLVYPGEMTIAEVFRHEHRAQRWVAWGYRFMGWILIFFAVTCTSRLLHILLKRVAFLAAIAPDPKFPIFANIILAFSMALIIASIVWVIHRPMIGAGLIFSAVTSCVWFARSVQMYE